jgi:hypothetical protein
MNQIIAEARSEKWSLGWLRKAKQTKSNSPILTGEARLQKGMPQTIVRQLEEAGGDEIVACLAAWKNYGADGPYLTVELSPKYVRREYRPTDRSNLSFIFSDDEEAQ